MIEISGQENKIEAFIERMRPFGIIELVRTGRIAMVRGAPAAKPEGESNAAPNGATP
jgi:acetolactate synthase I/III small subunit